MKKRYKVQVSRRMIQNEVSVLVINANDVDHARRIATGVLEYPENVGKWTIVDSQFDRYQIDEIEEA